MRNGRNQIGASIIETQTAAPISGDDGVRTFPGRLSCWLRFRVKRETAPGRDANDHSHRHGLVTVRNNIAPIAPEDYRHELDDCVKMLAH